MAQQPRRGTLYLAVLGHQMVHFTDVWGIQGVNRRANGALTRF